MCLWAMDQVTSSLRYIDLTETTATYRGLGSNGTENQRKHELEFALLVCDC